MYKNTMDIIADVFNLRPYQRILLDSMIRFNTEHPDEIPIRSPRTGRVYLFKKKLKEGN